MPDARRCRSLIILAAVLLLVAGCGKRAQPPEQEPASSESQPQSSVSTQEISINDLEVGERLTISRDEQAIRESERNRNACFHRQPGTTTTKVIKQSAPAKNAKNAKIAIKGKKTTATAPTATETKVVRTTGRCQPQCLIYARCRSGIVTCKLGDTNPVQWFACAAKKGDTSSIPHVGSVMIVPINASSHRIRSGHALYVEDAKKLEDGTWQMRISHTNYDHKCHLDLDAKVLFDPKRMTSTFQTGHWSHWAKDLKTLGFILR